ncbi:4-hydroxybenzoate 3-monooxygenase [Rhodococcus sp. 15-725-2-2b]|uniref:4-hydroxybenzoate 3-monooxygenase n=1 Tax=unclassified Rhodococcus (in: high G+C Gram-positive bacteria) TaxID=192944 RepID=UPI000B9A57C9|nr:MULTISPECIES: 4-hydroxybenzoate 3-monooxygenase [unclassified Rhodococcus (in: high G+C Gram-positive bacteria)]OZC61736.1 4-hydroxybenzoate 3-monooxygenase [Rhodococcus sp. 06-469-3-2]OZD42951.1 4-hydroxybenzoate 3-monooxygenase [Rhodococcus sp. 06-1477-1A]OZE11073.1 4-hydroxybenzoate 3-monooxygenase [Rhodococcus sp. 05-2255-3C]OZE14229.1 4-hydroxybenzoate 3-monooxygenase [Rhodococcus sp. 05-2255-3B1]OZE24801.1 4-hydroxybenzoate 3-monooxygenase [Rhodococcus sp. 05-2255-2A2]
MRTQVAIIGAGPAGLLLSHLLGEQGIDSVLIESRTQQYVLSRIRAGILEHSTVRLLDDHGLGERLHREGHEHRGIYLQWPEERHHIDFRDLVDRSVWVYGQTEVTKDLVAAREKAGQQIYYDVSDTALHDVESDAPFVTFTDASGTSMRIDADVIAGCDGSFGPSRAAMPDSVRNTWERTYPYSWLGVLADVAPSTDELIYAWHQDGFAMHSMRSSTVSRLYLQVPNGTDIATWSDERIWDALARRLGHGQDGWELTPGPITEKSVLPMRSYVQTPMRHGRLFLAGDAAHIVPPTGAKGLNLAVADVALLAPALTSLLGKNDSRAADAYSDDALRRVWRCTHFSWWMTTMLHTGDDPFDAQLQLSQLRWVASSEAGATGLAENYAGLPIGF